MSTLVAIVKETESIWIFYSFKCSTGVGKYSNSFSAAEIGFGSRFLLSNLVNIVSYNELYNVRELFFPSRPFSQTTVLEKLASLLSKYSFI